MQVENYLGLQHFPLEPCNRADAPPKLLEETADKGPLRYFQNDLYDCELEIVIGYFHIALSPTGDAWGMADFEENGATAVMHTTSSGIEDATSKIYGLLRLAEIDPYELTVTYLGIGQQWRADRIPGERR